MAASVYRWQAAGSIAALAVSAYTMVPVCLPYYTRKYYQSYTTRDTPEEVDNHSLSLVDDVLRKLEFPEAKEKKLDVFISHSTEPQYHGAFSMKGHCLLGLPISFKWRTSEDFESNKQRVFKKNFPFEHPDAQYIKQAMVLDDEEKEFLISRQLGYLDNRHPWAKLVQRLGLIAAGFGVAHFANYKLGYYEETRRIAGRNTRIGTIFCLVGIATAGVMTLVNDSYNCFLDMSADRYAATMSQQNAAAGMRYYDKIINSNKALRGLIPGAEYKFTLNGNETTGLFRIKTLPISARRDFMKKMVGETSI